ncbi:type II toxin-antitoxin system Phd/YefM family antitoxin [Patescibacteria group bacterium]|nr:type II toxin-antitoxin system Phd/YefM family antitoxin [Patescibacteria group bacterium]
MMIPTASDIKTVTDLRENTLALLDGIQKKKRPTIVMHRNSPRAVFLSVKFYNKLVGMLEDSKEELEAIELEREADQAKNKDLISIKKLLKNHKKVS